MTYTDWFIDLALIALVVLQLRGRRLTRRTLLLPIGLMSWAGAHYLRGIPTSSHDLALIVPVTLVGLALGTGAGILTHVYRNDDGQVIARATITAAVLWVVGVGCRLAFQLYATHGGGETIVRFSIQHHLSEASWTAALLLMAFAEVIARTSIVWWHGVTVGRLPQPKTVLSA